MAPTEQLPLTSAPPGPGDEEAATPAAHAPSRPASVTVVAWLAFLVGVYYIVDCALALGDNPNTSELVEAVTMIVLGAAVIVFGFGALRLRHWAWAALMTWAVAGLMNQLIRAFFFTDANYLAMALDVIAVFVLTPFDIQVAFGVRGVLKSEPLARRVGSDRSRPQLAAGATDLEILRAFEPVVRYTQGEKFFPMDVEPYVERCSLWLHLRDEADRELVPEGALTMSRLVEHRHAPFDTLFYLRFIGPLGFQDAAQAVARGHRLEKKSGTEFHAGLGRLARGGLLPRLGDGLFSLSFLLRGTVPQASAAAAALKYAGLLEQDERYVYHGRVVRQGDWTVCQYWFFFAYNPWRSGFHGVNDHEADWEMISVYLYEDGGQLVPEWVAYASHDFHGADLRRRFDDAGDLELVDGHPVAYAGAGSHASYFRRGEYQAEVTLPVPERLESVTAWLTRFWRTTLGQRSETPNPLRIPFIDFARGDGLAVGPGQEKPWTPSLIDERTPWVSRYRGLWGLFARDPISGENAPAGPMYNRDGSPRSSWFDPLGFAGLEQVATPPRELAALEAERARLEAQIEELDRCVPEASSRLEELGAGLRSMQGSPHLASESERLEIVIADAGAALSGLRRERTECEIVLEGLRRTIEHRQRGDTGDPRAHIARAAEPVTPSQMRFDRAAEIWAAISLSLLLVGLAVLVLLAPAHFAAFLASIVVVFLVTESILRGNFLRTANQVAVVLALIATVVLLVHIWEFAVVACLLAVAVYLVSQRLRELAA
jgi:hypothetical protein